MMPPTETWIGVFIWLPVMLFFVGVFYLVIVMLLLWFRSL
jgi:hypothetical protein